MEKPAWQLSGLPWIRNRVKAALDPNRFHGWGKRHNYFEGWYFKIVAPNQELAYAIIPGVSLQKDGTGHSFIQVLDGVHNQVEYHRFTLQEFQPHQGRFTLQIGQNFFSDQQLRIDLPGLKAALEFQNVTPWPKSLLAPGVMGWYGYIPGMECYHGMVSAHHKVVGSLENEQGVTALEASLGYIEKDWGSSFPAAWIWMQSNHLELDAPASLMASVAHIPWRGHHFRGFLCTWLWKGELHTFTSWNKSQHEVSFGEGYVDLHFRRNEHALTIRAYPAEAGKLISPTMEGMTGKINESLQAELEVKYEVDGKSLYNGKAKWAGLEVSEKAKEILR